MSRICTIRGLTQKRRCARADLLLVEHFDAHCRPPLWQGCLLPSCACGTTLVVRRRSVRNTIAVSIPMLVANCMLADKNWNDSCWTWVCKLSDLSLFLWEWGSLPVLQHICDMFCFLTPYPDVAESRKNTSIVFSLMWCQVEDELMLKICGTLLWWGCPFSSLHLLNDADCATEACWKRNHGFTSSAGNKFCVCKFFWDKNCNDGCLTWMYDLQDLAWICLNFEYQYRSCSKNVTCFVLDTVSSCRTIHWGGLRFFNLHSPGSFQ